MVDALLRYRWLLAVLTISAMALLSIGSKDLYFNSDYRAFFDEDDPQLVAHEALEAALLRLITWCFSLNRDRGICLPSATWP